MSLEPETAAAEAAAAEADVDVADEGPTEERDPFKRRVAVVLAVLGVLGAWIGILHQDSANQESFYARQTTRTAVGSMAANLDQETLAGLATDLAAESAALAGLAPFDSSAPIDSGGDEASEDLAAGADTERQERLARTFTRRAEFEGLSRKALAETRVGYNNRTSQFETVLTTLAVALFLVGFTLVLNRRTRPPVLIPGLILAAYVAGWALWIHAKEIPATAPEAIAAAADGGEHLAFGEFEAAVDDYTRAIEVDDDFVPAYNGRALASFQVSNPDFASTLAIVDTTTPESRLAASDAETAVALGQDQNFNSLLLSGIFRFHDQDYDGAERRFRQAVEVNDQAPEAYLALAVTELAQGDQPGALDELASGVELLDPAADSSEARQLAADLFTLLEQVDAAQRDVSEEVAGIRELLAARETELALGADGRDATGGTVALDAATYADGTLSFELAYDDLPDDAQVAIFVFERPTDEAPFAQRAELARFETLSGSGVLENTAGFRAACTPVEFRYDVYVNGTPAGSFRSDGGKATC
ncbi:MAG: hypothetical protein R2704_00400 [Microthrixaceae bacterium]